MKTPSPRTLLVAAAAIAATASCDSSNPTQPVPGVSLLYVDAAAGNDANPGTSSSPIKTLTEAMTRAASGHVVRVAPGTYDAALGEVFPIVVPVGVTVIGDTATRGAGATATLVEGTGPIGSAAGSAALVASANVSISGLTVSNDIGTGANIGVFTNSTNVRIAANTFTTTARGVQLGPFSIRALVRSCAFATPLYGMITEGSNATVQDNDFVSGLYGVDQQGGSSVIRRNWFTAAGAIGIVVQVGSPSIQDNVFTSDGYSTAAILARFTTAPMIRGNTFTLATGPAVRIQETSTADLGTSGSPGSNTFAITTGADVHHVSSATIGAIGNTWSLTPPGCGTQLTGTGTIVWGLAVGQQCP